MKLKLTLYALMLAGTVHAQAPPIFTGFDLNVGAAPSSPTGFVTVNNKMVFAAMEAATGTELWVSDGKPSGTQLLKDIIPGNTSSFPVYFISTGTKAFFAATDATTGTELWVTDGTAAGTQLVKDINTGTGSSGINSMVAYNNSIIFGAYNPATGNELWISDGTAVGTQMIKDINPGTAPSNPTAFIIYNGKVLFTAQSAAEGGELWITDGTVAGTQMVKDIYPGATGSFPASFTPYNGKMLYSANDGVNGYELWTTDGTSSGTFMVKDINPGIGNSYQSGIGVEYNGKIYNTFSDGINGYELWATDGTAAGTVMVKDINSGGGSVPGLFAVYNNLLYFRAMDANGLELWATDGTAANTKMVKDIIPGSGSGNPTNLIVYRKHLYFAANTATSGDYQVFRSDGTDAGTTVVKPSGSNANPLPGNVEFFMYDSSIYYRANYDANGQELWAMKDTTTTPPSNSIATAVNNAAMFRISPNPNHGNFNIIMDQDNAIITVYDAMGKAIYNCTTTRNTTNLHLTNAAKGIYFIKVQQGNDVGTKRIVVE